MRRVSKVRALPRYRLELEFDDGITGTVDVSENVGKGVYLTVTGKKPEDIFPALSNLPFHA